MHLSQTCCKSYNTGIKKKPFFFSLRKNENISYLEEFPLRFSTDVLLHNLRVTKASDDKTYAQLPRGPSMYQRKLHRKRKICIRYQEKEIAISPQKLDECPQTHYSFEVEVGAWIFHHPFRLIYYNTSIRVLDFLSCPGAQSDFST